MTVLLFFARPAILNFKSADNGNHLHVIRMVCNLHRSSFGLYSFLFLKHLLRVKIDDKGLFGNNAIYMVTQ